ncbi:hypothetical protein COLO4_30155 [Corchorus olitorius]|uniref:Uncharacterized protein n=1 Tax=Corchorus olitorius TaxID=93759 RepID=A0A1R3HAQ3_9ROSI|nr:hypothetical protein COLO4_30155 [Corchorus olitorius]
MGNEKKKGKEHISAKQRPYPLGKEEGGLGGHCQEGEGDMEES